MSEDLTDRFPPDADEPSTHELVLQLLDRVGKLTELVTMLADLPERMARVESALGIGEPDTKPLSGRVNRLIAEVAEVKDEMRSVRRFAFDAVGEMGRMNRDVDERVARLEHPEGAQP
jgi:hypothetical protein